LAALETGTGKTAAFLLPIIQITERPRPGVRVLVLAPTQNSPCRFKKNYTELNTTKSNRSVVVMGGTTSKQISEIRRGVSVVIATPGRLLDLTERGAINLRRSKCWYLMKPIACLTWDSSRLSDEFWQCCRSTATDVAVLRDDVEGDRTTRAFNDEATKAGGS
jgi:hypothetical protein